MTSYQALARNSVYVTAVNYAVYFVNIFVQIILARLLLPDDYGSFALAASIIEVAFVALALDISTAALQLGGRKEVYENAVAFSYLNCAVLTAAGAALTFALSFFLDREIVVIFAVTFAFRLFNLFSKLSLTFLEKDFLFLKTGLLKAAVRLLSLAAGVLMAWRGMGVYSLVAIDAINCLALFLLSLRASPLRFNRSAIDRALLASILRQSLRLHNYRISNILFYRLPNILIGFLTRGKTVVGLLDRGLYWAGLTNTVTSGFHSQVLFVFFTRNQEQQGVLEESLNWALWLLSRLGIVLALVFLLFPEEFVRVVLGSKWTDLAPYLRAMSAYAFFIVLYNVLLMIYVSLKRENVLTRTQHAANAFLILIVCAIFALDLDWSLLAAGFSVIASALFFYLALALRRENIRVRLWFVLRTPLIAAAAAGAGTALLGIRNLYLGGLWLAACLAAPLLLLERDCLGKVYRVVLAGRK